MSVSARMRVNSIIPQGEKSAVVNLNAVYSDDPNDPNYSYSVATPSANLQMFIANPDAIKEFKVGDTIDLTFTKYQPKK